MNIALIDADNESTIIKYTQDKHYFKYNLPLMKISGYHKHFGDSVFLYFNDQYNNIKLENYDKIYISKVFTYTKPIPDTFLNSKKVFIGGVAIDKNIKLPYAIEHFMPDYSLYNIEDISMGFITRGCPRNCKFCYSYDWKENKKTYVSNDFLEFLRPNSNNLIFLHDDNFLSLNYSDCIKELDRLLEYNCKVFFHSGIDIRYINDDLILKKFVKLIKNNNNTLDKDYDDIISFSWDEYLGNNDIIKEKYKILVKHSPNYTHVINMLCGYFSFDKTDIENLFKRVEYLSSFDTKNYYRVMIFKDYLKDLTIIDDNLNDIYIMMKNYFDSDQIKKMTFIDWLFNDKYNKDKKKSAINILKFLKNNPELKKYFNRTY